MSPATGVYTADAALPMAAQFELPLVDLAHCQDILETLPSGSDRAALRAAPTRGCVDRKVTVPARSGEAALRRRRPRVGPV